MYRPAFAGLPVLAIDATRPWTFGRGSESWLIVATICSDLLQLQWIFSTAIAELQLERRCLTSLNIRYINAAISQRISSP